jgi:hypothetical protein
LAFCTEPVLFTIYIMSVEDALVVAIKFVCRAISRRLTEAEAPSAGPTENPTGCIVVPDGVPHDAPKVPRAPRPPMAYWSCVITTRT